MENNIIQYNTGKCEMLLVKVPGNGDVAANDCTFYYWSGEKVLQIELPKGFWTVVGNPFVLSEEVWRGIIPQSDGWFNRFKDTFGNFFWTPTESGISLLQHLEVYEVNPIPRPEYHKDYNEEWIYEYEKAQAKTGNWILLTKNR